MTGRNSYWLANVARLLDAILTPGQHIERETLVMEGLVTERTICYQYCKMSLSLILVTDTRHTQHRLLSHSCDECQRQVWRVWRMSVTSVGEWRMRQCDTCHRHSSPTLDAILTPGQRIESMEGLVMERTISYQYCKTSPSLILVTVTRHTCDECRRQVWRVWRMSVTSVTSVGEWRVRHSSHSSPTLVTDTPHICHRH